MKVDLIKVVETIGFPYDIGSGYNIRPQVGEKVSVGRLP